MKKILIMPDSFKGTMTSHEVSDIMKTAVEKHFPESKVIVIPVSDGGEGSIDAFNYYLNGDLIDKSVTGPYFDKTSAKYLISGSTAIIEMAQCAGLHLTNHKPDPTISTTYGIGELILDAIDHHAKQITLCIGGSATNDAGAGMLSALGVDFYNKNKQKFIPTGGTLIDIDTIDIDNIRAFNGVSVTVIVDVDNLLFGEHGAAHIYGPQKGADKDSVVKLDQGLRHFAGKVFDTTGINISHVRGGGAGGGIAAGITGFLNVNLKSGIEEVLDISQFDLISRDVDVIFSGEGKIDSQTANGKVISGIAKRAKHRNIPLIVCVGDIDSGYDQILEMGVTSIFSINSRASTLEQSRQNSKENLNITMDNILRLLKNITQRRW